MPSVMEFYTSLVNPCSDCGSYNVELVDFYERGEASGLLQALGQVYGHNHPGMHFMWKCYSCGSTGRRHYSGEYVISAGRSYLRRHGYDV